MLEASVVDKQVKTVKDVLVTEIENGSALNSVAFVTQGCRLNQAESATLSRSLKNKLFKYYQPISLLILWSSILVR